MNILIVNQPLNNRGDESAHKGLVRKILASVQNVKIKVLWVSANPDSVEQFRIHNPNVEYINIVSPGRGYRKFSIPGMIKGCRWIWNIHPTTRKLLAVFKWADCVLCAPGGICMGGFQNWTHLYFLDMARYLKKDIVYFGRSIGPFPVETESNRKFKDISLSLLRSFKYCSLRDSNSQKLADTLGIKYDTTVDSAFLDDPKVDIPLKIKNVIGSSKYVVFVPNLLIWHYAYKGRTTKNEILEFYAKLIKEINNKYANHKILMLPQTFNCGTYEGDDYLFFKDLVEFVDDNSVFAIPDIYSSDVQQTIIADCSCMIGARYHSVVFSINQSVPFVALSYEHKISGLLKSLGKEDCMIDISNTFDSIDNLNNTINLFKEKLNSAKRDPECTIEAKQIANVGFAKMLESLTIHNY